MVRGGGVDVITGDGEDLATFEVIRERGSVIARALGDIAGDRNIVLAGDDERGVVGPRDRLRDRKVGAIGEDTAVAHADRTDRADAFDGEAEEAAVGVEAAGEGIGDRRIEDPDAAVVLVDREQAAAADGQLVGELRRHHVEIRVHAAELERLGLGGHVREVRSRRVIDQVGQDEGARTTGFDTAGAGGAGQVDRARRDFARADIDERHGVREARVAELEPTAADIGTEAGRGRARGADRGDDEAFVAEDRIARIRVQVAEDEVRPARLGQRARTADDAGDRREIQAGVAVVVDVEVMPAAAGDRGVGRDRRGDVLA